MPMAEKKQDVLNYEAMAADSKNMPLARDYSDLRNKLTRRLEEMRTSRSPWVTEWATLAEYIAPQMGKFILRSSQTRKGKESRKEIVNNAPYASLRTLAAGMLGGMSSPTKPWFRLTAPQDVQDDSEVKQWLAECEERIRAAMHKSNFYGALSTAYADLGLFGTHALLMYEDEETVIRCFSLPVGTYFLSADDKGDVKTLMREFNMTLYQMVERFGEKNLSDSALSMWRSRTGLEREYTLAQAIFPNKDYNPKGRGKEKWEYCDVTWEVGGDSTKLLEYKGFREKPFLAPRWSVLNGTDVYGESPAMHALPDIKSLQKLATEQLKAVGKIVSPPMLAPTSLKNEPAYLIPNGITFVPDVVAGRMTPVHEVNYQVPSIIQSMIDQVQVRIDESFFRNLWMMLDNLEGVQPRSQLELIKREGEKILQLSPVIQKVQGELLEGAIDRYFSVMFLRGLLPPPPVSMRDKMGSKDDLKVEYTSELSVAQNAKDTVPIEQFASFTGNLAAVFPEARDKFDVDAAMDEYGSALGVNPKIIRATDKADEIREARNKQMQQQQMMEQGLAMAQGAKTLSETQVGGGTNALAMAMGGGV